MDFMVEKHPLNLNPGDGSNKYRPLLPRFSASDQAGSPIYAVAFSSDIYQDTDQLQYFATCAGTFCNVYEIRTDARTRVAKTQCIQIYQDNEESEEYYCVAWGGATGNLPFQDTQSAQSQNQLIALAGIGRTIKIIDPVAGKLMCTLVGHGEEIYELQFAGTSSTTSFCNEDGKGDENLLLSCCKDESIRMWNVRTGTCLAIFAGDRGHREHVLSLDIHPTGGTFVSGGMDTSVKIWSFCDDEALRSLVKDSEKQNGSGWAEGGEEGGNARSFKAKHFQFPSFSTNKVHTDYVDCVKFCGDSLLSKSVANVILMWDPVMTAEGKKAGDIVALREFVLTQCEVWFVRFALDNNHRWLGMGNRSGNVKVWNLDEEGAAATTLTAKPKNIMLNMKAANCNKLVRMVAFSPQGDFLVCACEDGGLFMYDFGDDVARKEEAAAARPPTTELIL